MPFTVLRRISSCTFLYSAVFSGSYKGTVIFPAKTNYALTCAVLVLSIAAIAVSLFAGLAYYVIWGAAVLLFVLAVWYTVKML